MPRSSRIQWSRVAVYWAVLTFGLVLFWSVALNLLNLRGVGPAVTLVFPALLGALFAFLLYKMHLRQVLEYDDFGYSITKGRSQVEHKWAEFKECSVLRDSYGNKVRVYRERDRDHSDIDAKACGIDPYTLRDFVSSRINANKSTVPTAEIFSGLEKEIQRGRAYWVADLNETFKPYQISGEVFPMMARGNTRPKGFVLSRFIAVTIMPNYSVAMYAHELGGYETAKPRMMHLVRIIETMREEKNIKWSWLLLFTNDEPPESIVRAIEGFTNEDIGIGCIDIGTGRLVNSRNQLGRSLRGQMHFNHLIRDLRRKRLIQTGLS
jgi:hypothetical protein